MTLLLLASQPAGAQQPIGSVALGDLVQGLGVTARVLVIGAHPDDEDTYLISWLARGRHVETAYLSLTRGEGGQNLIGNELGYALGQIRTEELLAARRVDGGRQFFTRAVDFGFTKTMAEAEAKWPRPMLLKDMVAVIRAFRPHVIVSVWTGTEADGHGHHQYAGVLAKEAFHLAADSSALGGAVRDLPPWAARKLYRVARVRGGGGFSITTDASASPGNVRFNVGEYSPLFGRSYAELAAQSRSQHLSQGMGMVLPRGTVWDGLTLDTTTFGLARDADTAIFTGIDTSWSRFTAGASPRLTLLLDSLRTAVDSARPLFDGVAPRQLVGPLSSVLRLAQLARAQSGCPTYNDGVVRCVASRADLHIALTTTIDRASRALLLAAGVAVDALADREKVALRDSVDVTVAVYNRGKSSVVLVEGSASVEAQRTLLVPRSSSIAIAPDSTLRLGGRVEMPRLTYPWWMLYGTDATYAVYDLKDNRGANTALVAEMLNGEERLTPAFIDLRLTVDGTPVQVTAPVVHRFADPAKGEQRRQLVGVPKITTLFQSNVEYIRANRPVDRGIRVEVRSAWSKADTVNVQISLPAGLRADSAARRVVLPPFGKASVFFRVTGRVPQKEYKVTGIAVDRVGAYSQGYIDILYDHIAPVRYYQPPEMYLSAVDVNVPTSLSVAYVQGVGDNIQRQLEQLDVRVKALAPEAIPLLDLRAYSTLVIGPRAYEAIEAVASSATAIQDFARRGGTVVVQYQQTANRPGVLPFPVTFAAPSVDRVADERAPVTLVAPGHGVVTSPNRITVDDFRNWGQERGLYMPRTFDGRYKALFEMHDPGELPNYGAVLVAPLGKGTFVYTSLSFFRQLPGGNPGAARLFVNLLSAGLPATRVP